MKKLTIVTRFKNVYQNLAKSFEIPHRDEKTGKNTWVSEIDFKIEAQDITTTNNMLMFNKKPWAVMNYDLSKIKRANGNAESNEVSFYEIIEAIKNASPARVAQGVVRIVVTPENKSDVIKAIKDGLISKANNTITDTVLKKETINVIPDLSADFDDADINGMEDIEKEIKKVQKSKKKELDQELEAQLKE